MNFEIVDQAVHWAGHCPQEQYDSLSLLLSPLLSPAGTAEQVLTCSRSSMALRCSGCRRSGLSAMRSTLTPPSRPRGTGTTCISPFPACSAGRA